MSTPPNLTHVSPTLILTEALPTNGDLLAIDLVDSVRLLRQVPGVRDDLVTADNVLYVERY